MHLQSSKSTHLKLPVLLRFHRSYTFMLACPISIKLALCRYPIQSSTTFLPISRFKQFFFSFFSRTSKSEWYRTFTRFTQVSPSLHKLTSRPMLNLTRTVYLTRTLAYTPFNYLFVMFTHPPEKRISSFSIHPILQCFTAPILYTVGNENDRVRTLKKS